jgi:hypothetical protein
MRGDQVNCREVDVEVLIAAAGRPRELYRCSRDALRRVS